MLSDAGLRRMSKTIYETMDGEIAQTLPPYGVELEIEGSRLPNNVEGWRVHEEGSLRGEGREYVTAGAVTRATLSLALDFLEASFRANRAQPRDSYRAGVHVHYNVQQRSVASVLRAVVAFTLFEPIFLKMCGSTRDGNLFCMSSYDTGDLHFWMRNILLRAENGSPAMYFRRGKYSSLNVDPLTTFGTLECRAFPNSWSKTQILEWVDLLEDILKIDVHPRTLMVRAIQEPEALMREVFGDRSLPADKNSLLGFGVEQIYMMVDVYCEFMGEPE